MLTKNKALEISDHLMQNSKTSFRSCDNNPRLIFIQTKDPWKQLDLHPYKITPMHELKERDNFKRCNVTCDLEFLTADGEDILQRWGTVQ
jgi:hypothetical protein